MKKIIAAIDGLKYSTATTSWATQVARMSDSHLVGVFLEDEMYTSFNVYELLVKRDVPERKLQHYRQKDQDQRDKSVQLFSKACDHAAVNYSIHRDHNPALQELVHESVFADLLVIDKRETFTHYEEPAPALFIRDALAGAHCPVLLVTEAFEGPDKVIILYDGHPSSVYALKMFSYLFASFKHLPIEVVAFKPIMGDGHLPDNALMKEFVKRHLPKADFKIIKGKDEQNITAYFLGQTGNPLVVMGAYGRGMFSRWMRPSTADLLIRNTKFPLLITHE